jgi:hypothetical protein
MWNRGWGRRLAPPYVDSPRGNREKVASILTVVLVYSV